jgi:hypothetical protein
MLGVNQLSAQNRYYVNRETQVIEMPFYCGGAPEPRESVYGRGDDCCMPKCCRRVEPGGIWVIPAPSTTEPVGPGERHEPECLETAEKVVTTQGASEGSPGTGAALYQPGPRRPPLRRDVGALAIAVLM